MDKNLLIFIAVGLIFIYFVTNFVSTLQEEDELLQSSAYQKKHSFDQFMKTDSIGQNILDVEGESAEVQVSAWNQSKLKDELIEYFPDFDTMKLFAKERVRGEILRTRLYEHIDNVEKRFFSGEIDAEKAKKELEVLKDRSENYKHQ
ncbi:hypothetical protein [Sulfurovum sp.]|jgi:hypothetical protein|uniref:hypothetical protein n=1 Tax=Sulfurovum sp. TaxID=1969726 RepID=UPI002A36EF7F|nr:hypothetical protein [Sulfurovum sp.]MDD2450656.1 hypothetical protein [Sulfurovum sp.]MDD3499140.1 hypothetical protein [Sulfurovum sp.]MDY0402819.1 hypothetical protein [Sulfurovum sp.]